MNAEKESEDAPMYQEKNQFVIDSTSTTISVQISRIQNNKGEVEVNPGPEAVWNDHACKVSHGLSSTVFRGTQAPALLSTTWPNLVYIATQLLSNYNHSRLNHTAVFYIQRAIHTYIFLYIKSNIILSISTKAGKSMNIWWCLNSTKYGSDEKNCEC